MRITCAKKHLQQASLLCEKIAGRNPTLPILNSVLVSAKEKELSFLSTNLEMALNVSVPAKIKKEGKAAVPAKFFSSFVSSLPEDQNIEIETINDNLVLTTKNTTTTIKCYPVSDFPILPKIKEKKMFSMSSYDFLMGLKSVHYSVSLSEMKPEINSVFVYSNKNGLVFAATDGFRLAEKIVKIKTSGSLSFLIPHRSVAEMLRIFEHQEGNLTIKFDDNNIVLDSGSIKFTSRLVEGNFPDYKQIIPTGFSNTVTVEKKDFSDNLKTAIMFCGKLNEVKMKLYKSEDFIEIQTNNPEVGEHSVTVPAKTEGNDLGIVFNYRYLVDFLPAIDSDKILLRFSGEGRPLAISGLNDSSFFYLIMPMKDL